MNASETTMTPSDFLNLLRTHPRRWILPAIFVTVAAAVFSVTWLRSWVATQPLIVRNEATDAQPRGLGKFRHDNEMKVTLETILEIARSRGVLTAALREVGPSTADTRKKNRPFPTAKDVADLQKAIMLTPPKGAEFGKTEVFYLKVKDRSRSRALALVSVICNRLELRLQELRLQKANSMIDEIEKTVILAQTDLVETTRKVRKIEKSVGSDLVELRILHRSASDSSDLRRKIVEVSGELRRNKTARISDEELLRLLKAAQDEPAHLLAAPNTLLVSQPALKRLKDGLVDAQIRASQLQGRLTDRHPRVQATRNAEQEIKQHLHNEIAIAVRGIEANLRMADARSDLLQRQLNELEQRAKRLAGLRADYSNLIADSDHQTRLLAEARTNLMNARADRAGAATSSLLNRIDSPETGTRPAGPGHATILLAGVFGGLMIGFGLLMLTVQPMPPESRDRRLQPAGAVAANSAVRPEHPVTSFEQAL